MTLDKKIFLELLIKAYQRKNYAFFHQGEYNLNIFGVRNSNKISNQFDDLIGVAYKYQPDKWCMDLYEATTDPGKYWLNNPMTPAGTAILMPGQYRGAYKLGKHQGKYMALVQNKPVRVWRDNNKDDVLDFNGRISQEGNFGINIHRSSPYDRSYLVDKWSAGCQVFKKSIDYDNFIILCVKASKIYGQYFTYTLFNESEFLLTGGK